MKRFFSNSIFYFLFSIFSFIALLFFVFYFLNFVALAATNIDGVYRYAWNDVIGWIDFQFVQNQNVEVTSQELKGYASSSVGYIALNCNSTPNGDICGTSDFKVSNNGNGYLSGWAYNDAIGWISFSCTNPETSGCIPPSGNNYQVNINSTTGEFSGWAWSENVGWISFNKSNCDVNSNGYVDSTCEGDDATTIAYDYKVQTNWNATPIDGHLISSVFDSQATGGAAINSIMWKGALNNGEVKFQIASSENSNGPWNYMGPDGMGNTYYNPGDSGLSSKINLINHNNKRYFRYKIFLYTDSGKTQSPRVEDIVINWSP